MQERRKIHLYCVKYCVRDLKYLNRFTRSDYVIIRNKFLVFQELPQLVLSWKSPRKNSPKSSEAAMRPCGCILEFSLPLYLPCTPALSQLTQTNLQIKIVKYQQLSGSFFWVSSKGLANVFSSKPSETYCCHQGPSLWRVLACSASPRERECFKLIQVQNRNLMWGRGDVSSSRSLMENTE